MLTTKLLKNTFGAKIKPYGFEYKGFKHRRWTFDYKINNETRHIVVQKIPEVSNWNLIFLVEMKK